MGNSPVCAILISERRKSEGPGRFLERTPGLLHAGARERARVVCIAFMPAMHGVVQSHVDRAWRCPNRLIGCTTARAAGSRCGSAAAVTAATCTAPGRAPVYAGASRCAAPVNATNSAPAGHADTRRASGPGASGAHIK